MTLPSLFLLSAVASRPLSPPSPSEQIAGAAVESSSSQPLGEPLTLARALEMLASDNPRTEAERAPIEVARADVVAAKVAPNPSLDYSGTRLRSGTNTGAADVDQLGVDWPVLIFGQRRKRVDAAECFVRAAEARVDASYAERARDLRKAFAALIVQQDRVEILEEARADLEHVSQVVAGRRDAGGASDYDALRVATEFRSMEAEVGDGRADLADARGRVATLLARPGFLPRAVGEVVPVDFGPLDAGALWTQVEAGLPALVAARADETAASAQERSALRDRWPVPSLTGGVVKTRDASSTSAMFGVTLPLPSLDRNQGAVARARAQQDEAALTEKALEAETRSDLSRAVEVARRRREALAALDSGVSSKLPEIRTMAEAAYREGRGGILDLLDALRSLTATRLARLDALGGIADADADLLYLLGRAHDPGR